MNAMTYRLTKDDADFLMAYQDRLIAAQQARDTSPRTQALGTADAPSDEPAGRGTLPPSLRRAIPIGGPAPVAVAHGTVARTSNTFDRAREARYDYAGRWTRLRDRGVAHGAREGVR